MTIRENIKKTLYTFGLTGAEYKAVEQRIFEDNRRRLFAASLLLSFFLLGMLVLSFFVEILAETRTIYLYTMLLTLAQNIFAQLGKKNKFLVGMGVYLLSTVAFGFGVYQGIVTAPEEQVASFLVLIVAVPVWFTMKPANMIRFIYLTAAVYITCVVYIKDGYVETSDIVNTMVYSTVSVIVSTYYTTIKAKRFYAEYLTERMGMTDMLTGLGNRHAYNETVDQYEKEMIPDELTVIYLDVNELKNINDTLGHHAGDELICGAADCISQVFSSVGGCFRTGGDEFIVLGIVSEEQRAALFREFDRVTENWKGQWGQQLRVSYGGASAREVPGGDLVQIAKLADNRLYEAKALYYSTKGIDRREQQKAYRAMCASYIKIMQANLNDDICKVIHNEPGDRIAEPGAVGKFNQWMENFASSDRIHPDDAQGFLEKANTAYLKEYFSSGKNTLHIYYRRKLGDRYYAVMSEFAPAPEYTEEQPLVYLYVKNIDKMD